MRDAFDAMGEAGGSAADAVARRLADDAAPTADVDHVRRGRRRWLAVLVSAGVLAVLAIGLVTWAARPAGPQPVGDIASARIAEVPVFDARADRHGCVPSDRPEPYVPWAPPGVTAASPEVRDSGIRAEATALLRADASVATRTVVEPASLVEVPGGTAGGDLVVNFRISWTGDALYEVDAAAILVAGGRVLSPAVGWYGDATDQEVWGGGSAVPRYDPASDTSEVGVVSAVQPTCLAARPGSQAGFGVPDGAAQLHTVVQVKDEDGQPLATFVDAAGLDRTRVAYPGLLDAGAEGARLVPPTDDEVAVVLAERGDGAPPEPSGAARVRDAVEADGVPLSQAGAGLRLSGRCEALEADVVEQGLELPVVPIADDRLDDFPRELPAETIRGSRSVDLPHNPGENPLRGVHTLLLLDRESGSVEASLPLRLFNRVGGATTTVLAGASTSCTDRDIAPGDYQAVMIDPNDRTDEALALADALQPVTSRWFDLGVITVLP